MLYDSRVKLQRDEESRLRGAHQAGRQEGLIAGRILLLQQLLDVPQWRDDEFARCSPGELQELEEKLQRELQARMVRRPE